MQRATKLSVHGRADFLRLSRAAIDDSITQQLNALITPATSGLDTSTTKSGRYRSTRSQQIDQRSCRRFKETVLFPAWQTRSDVLNYCASVATSPDPGDPDALLRGVESARARERVIDERLDPYSGRYFPREARTEKLTALLRNERGVEKIVRERTWGLVTERCDDGNTAAEDALNAWRR